MLSYMSRMFIEKRDIRSKLLTRSNHIARLLAAALLASNVYPCPDLHVEQYVGQVAYRHASTYTMTHCQQVALIETIINAC